MEVKPGLRSNKTTKPRGFAALSKDRRARIARLGGKIAHANGKAHEFTMEQARDAGRKGGAAVSADRAHMSEIGKKGARTRAANRAKRKAEQNKAAKAA